MKIRESCACSAAFEVNAEAGEAVAAVMSWRATHRHEATAEVVEEEESE